MGGGYQPKRSGVYAVAQRIFNIERSIAALNARISGLGIQVDKANGKLIISAGRSLEVDGSEIIGGSLTVTGDTLIEGNLSVPNGSINNAALANPVSFANGNADANSTNFTVAGSNLAVVTISVPSGFTSAEVMCFSVAGNTRNLGAGVAPFYVQAWIGSSFSTVLGTDCVDGGSASISAAWTASLTGLSGSFQAGTWAAVDSTTGWKSGGADAHTVVSATFLR